MKKFPHEPKLAKYLPEKRKENRARYEKLLAQYAKRKKKLEHGSRADEFFFGHCWTMAYEQAAMEYASDAPMSDVKALLLAACKHCEDEFSVGVLFPGRVEDSLLWANLCNQTGFRQRLEKMDLLDTDPEIKSDKLDFAVTEMVKDMSAGRTALASRIKSAQRLVKAPSVRPDRRRSICAKILFGKAMLKKNQKQLDEAVNASVEEHRLWHTKQAKDFSLPYGLLDVGTLGYLKIAKRYGLQTSVQSVYLPLELLED